MPDFILLMHGDSADSAETETWGPYIESLVATGRFQGGSAIGGGVCARRSGSAAPLSGHLTGFIRIEADDLAQAQTLLLGNPVYEAGGTVEIRELPRTD